MHSEKIDKENIQGDIWPGLPKKYESFYFFNITDVPKFRTHLQTLIPKLTTAENAVQDRGRIRQHKLEVKKGNVDSELFHLSGVNIAFTAKGLAELGKSDLKAGAFEGGMFTDLTGEGRDVPDDWNDEYKRDKPMLPIHGVIIVSGSDKWNVHHKLRHVEWMFIGFFSASIKKLFVEDGQVRPPDHKGEEHFGFQDGVSQPAIEGLDDKPEHNCPKFIPPGIIINGRDGETFPQPDWAKDGSFLVFRKLQQFVPEFDKFLDDKAPELHFNSEQLAARMMGRWKSGAPVCLTPDKDDPKLAKSNAFDYEPIENQNVCPYAAHTRKTRPRADFDDESTFTIIRRGIAYGPEVTKEEKKKEKTEEKRGMLFVCYQSNISNGFQFLTNRWCNQDNFPEDHWDVTGDDGPGADPICGQPYGSDKSTMSICDGKKNTVRLTLDSWVTPRGGEYFFSPSIAALKAFSKG